MELTYTTAQSRKDRALTFLAPTDGALCGKLLHAVCCNSATGYVREAPGGVLVPTHALAGVAASLAKQGWTQATRE